MPSAFPASFDNLTNPIPDDPLASGTVPHATQHTNLNDIVEAMQAKIGLGPVPGGPSTGPAVLRRTAPNMSDWGQVQSGDLADGAITGVKIGTGEITTTHILNGTIQDIDIAAAAAIALSKLAHVGAGNVLKSNGSANIGGQVVNADVAAAAGIILSKIAGGAAGLIKSNGSVLTSGNQLAAVDVPNGLITGTMIADATITNADIADGQVSSSKIQDRTIAAGDIAVGTITPTEIANGLSSSYAVQDSTAITIGVGAWGYTGLAVTPSGLTPGVSRVFVLFQISAYVASNNAPQHAGIGLDNASSPNWSAAVSQAPGINNQVMPMIVANVFTASATAHTLYGLWMQSGTGPNMTRYGNSILGALVINR